MVSRCDKGGLAGRYFNFSTTIDLAGICTVSLLPLSFAPLKAVEAMVLGWLKSLKSLVLSAVRISPETPEASGHHRD